MAIRRKKKDDFQSAMRTDAKSTRKRDEMRTVAKGLQRDAAAHVRDDSWRTRIDTNRKLERMGMAGLGHSDTWQNSITALGTSRDKRLGGKFLTNRVIDLEAEDIWRGDDMAGRAVETVPNQIVRAGFEVTIKAEQPKTPEEEKKKARLDFLRSREGTRWWMAKVEAVDAPAEIKKKLAEKIRTDLASAVFPPDDKAELQSSGKELTENMNAQLDELCVIDRVGEAMKAERGYGGAALFPGIIDGVRDLTRPLNYDRIQSIDWLDVLTPLELVPFQWYDDPVEKNYGEPELFWMQRISIGNVGSTARIPIHESRLIRFPGLVVSRRQLREHWGWGDSVLVRMMEVLRDFQQSWQGAASLIADFAQAVLSIQGLAASFASGEDSDRNLLADRAAAMDLGRSVARAIIIDTEEKFERLTTPITGLPDMLDRFCNRLAASAHLPVTLLMGQAPAGLNATGDSDVRAFYDNVGANRERQLKPRLTTLMKMMFAARQGPAKGKEPEKWTWKFGALWQPTEKEEAERRYLVAQADQIYIVAQVLIPEEVAISRFGGDAYSAETHLDRDVREQADAKAEEEAEAQAEQMQEQTESANKTAMVAAKTPAAGPNIHIHAPGAAPGKPGAGGPPKPGAPKPGAPAPAGAKPAGAVPKKDGSEDQPRASNGQWGEGGEGHASLKKASLGQIAVRITRLMSDNTPAATAEYKAVVAELKTRGIKSFPALEKALKKADDAAPDPDDDEDFGEPFAPASRPADDFFRADDEPWEEDGSLPDGLGIPRGLMPQIVSQHVQEFLSGLRAKGVSVTEGWTPVGQLKPMQNAIQPAKVRELLEVLPVEALQKPIVISDDNHILDGHHRWAALRMGGVKGGQQMGGPLQEIQTRRVGLPASELLAAARAFPKAEYRDFHGDDFDESKVERDENGKFTGSGAASPVGRKQLNPNAATSKHPDYTPEFYSFGSNPQEKKLASFDLNNNEHLGSDFSSLVGVKSEKELASLMTEKLGLGNLQAEPGHEIVYRLAGSAGGLANKNAGNLLGIIVHANSSEDRGVLYGKVLTAYSVPMPKEFGEYAYLRQQGAKDGSEDQPRDEKGQWSSNGGGGSSKSKPEYEKAHRSLADPTNPEHWARTGAEERAYKTVKAQAAYRENVSKRAENNRQKLVEHTAHSKPLPAGHTPEQHLAIAREVKAEHDKHLPAEKAKLADLVAKSGVQAQVKGRTKAIESSMNKIADKEVSAREKGTTSKYQTARDLQDSTGMRVVVSSEKDVHTAVAAVERSYTVIGKDDYVTNPKEGTGYRSVHLIVETKAGPAEVQIRTHNMDAHAVWAHDVYKPMNAHQEKLAKSPAVNNLVKEVADHFSRVDRGVASTPPHIPDDVKAIFGSPYDKHH